MSRTIDQQYIQILFLSLQVPNEPYFLSHSFSLLSKYLTFNLFVPKLSKIMQAYSEIAKHLRYSFFALKQKAQFLMFGWFQNTSELFPLDNKLIQFSLTPFCASCSNSTKRKALYPIFLTSFGNISSFIMEGNDGASF